MEFHTSSCASSTESQSFMTKLILRKAFFSDELTRQSSSSNEDWTERGISSLSTTRNFLFLARRRGKLQWIVIRTCINPGRNIFRMANTGIRSLSISNSLSMHATVRLETIWSWTECFKYLIVSCLFPTLHILDKVLSSNFYILEKVYSDFVKKENINTRAKRVNFF